MGLRRYSVEVPLRIKENENPTAWARKHCPSYLSATWHIHEDKNQSYAEYHFWDEKDANWFMLRWS